MRFIALLALLVAGNFFAISANAADALVEARAELAPSGTMRVAVGIGPAPSGFYGINDPQSDGYRGVTIDLAIALGERLGVPISFIAHDRSGEIQMSADDGVWDLTFMPVDDARKQIVDFGSAYHLLQSTYLVSSASSITSVEEANREGFRVVGVSDTATFRASNAASPLATHIALDGPEDTIALMLAGGADAIALGRESLHGILGRIPGGRIVDDAFLNSTTAVAVPKGKPAALAFVTAFVEEAKATGFVRQSFDRMGLQNSIVAPLGMIP
jgi:polar amino acid transport system substrate-binding protein